MKHRAQSIEHRTQNTEHIVQSTEHRPQNTEHRTQSWLIASYRSLWCLKLDELDHLGMRFRVRKFPSEKREMQEYLKYRRTEIWDNENRSTVGYLYKPEGTKICYEEIVYKARYNLLSRKKSLIGQEISPNINSEIWNDSNCLKLTIVIPSARKLLLTVFRSKNPRVMVPVPRKYFVCFR